MNGRVSDPVPLAVRGVLLTLVVCLHLAGAVALLRLSELPRRSEESVILRASWIENAAPAAPLLLPSPAVQPPLPVVRPASPPRAARAPGRRRAHARNPVPAPSRIRPAAVQSAPALVAEDISPSVSTEEVASNDSTPSLHIDLSPAVTAAVDEMARGGGNRDYVGPNFNVNYLSNPEPEYPFQSRRLREQGLVKLRVHVTEAGRAGEVMLYASSGFERLDKAALEAVKRWQFQPARRAGTPVAGWVIVPVRFELQG